MPCKVNPYLYTMKQQFSLSEINKVAEELLQRFPAVRCMAFYGELGAGKTTLVRSLCAAMGVKDLVNSPTFSIINEYRMQDGRKVFHMDWYRLQHTEDAIGCGIEELLQQPDAVCLIEWPERAPDLIPPDALRIHLQTVGEDSRLLSVL